MTSLLAILGLDSSRFRGGLNQSVNEANAAGGKIASGLSKGGKIEGLRHIVTIFRDLARGDIPAATRSAGMLANSFGLLKFLLNPVTAVIVGLGAGLFAAYKLAGALSEKLSSLKFPDLHPEYIAKHLQASHASAEAQKEINRELEKTIDLHFSAAKAAERQAEATKDHYEHLRKMQEFAMQGELAQAGSEAQREAIRKKYSAQALKLSADERAQKLNDKDAEAKALDEESKRLKTQGDQVVVGSKAHDEEILHQRKTAADEAQKYLDDLEKTKGGAKDKLVRGYNAVALSGVSGKDLTAAENANKEEARRRISSYKEFVDQSAEYEEKRRQKEALYKGAAKSAAESVNAAMDAAEMKKSGEIKSKDEQEEAAAKLLAENEKGEHKAYEESKLSRNSLQTIGAYGAESPREQQMLDAAKTSVVQLQKIEGHLSQIAGKGGAPNRGVGF